MELTEEEIEELSRRLEERRQNPHRPMKKPKWVKRTTNVVNLERWLYVKARPGIVLYATVKEAIAAKYPPKPAATIYDLTPRLPTKKAIRMQAKMRRDARAEEDRFAAERGEEWRGLASMCVSMQRKSIAESKALLAGHRPVEPGNDAA